MNPSVLVVDDERTFRVLAEEALSSEGFEVRGAASLSKAKTSVGEQSPDVIILDRRLPDGDGIEWLREIHEEAGDSGPLVVVVTAHGDVENAVEALHAGAWDYLTKPVQVTDLVVKLRKVIEARGLRDRLQIAKSSNLGPPQIPPRSEARRKVIEKLEQVAESPLTPVLLLGPSGAGKQFAAEMLHSLTYGKTDDTAPFVEVNCAAIPENLLESELFGHEKGAFTDAKTTHRGLVELADGGTLFLDEVTELPEWGQAKLLKFLDSMRFRRVGGPREIKVKTRVIAATNKDLATMVKQGQFREDLFHRLAVFQVEIPPLAACREDIPELAQGFLAWFASRVKKPVKGLSAGAMAALKSYGYPGNVRELRNILERAVILARGPEVTERDIILAEDAAATHAVKGAFFSVSLETNGDPPLLEKVEREYVVRMLAHHQGRRMAAAQALGISYPTFLKRLRELGLE
ncbi:MAG TPA: sigma-54 dependent transcriptional regulator [bacterium]|nr:sigma-54 dependent transcriptional regulator [bacterium]